MIGDGNRIDEFEMPSNSSISMLSPSTWPYGDATSSSRTLGCIPMFPNTWAQSV
jgi:hypothetical protein